MLRLIKKLFKRVFKSASVTALVLGTLTFAVVGMGLADQPFFASLYIPGNTVADYYTASVPVAWFHLAQQLARDTPGYAPPVVARAFAYMGVTLYEAVLPGMPGYVSLAGQVNGLQPIDITKPGSLRHWPTVANSALAEMTRSLFPTASPENVKAINALKAQFDASFRSEIREDVFAKSQQHGELVARRIFEWSLDDGGHEAYLASKAQGYSAPTGSGLWQTTPPQHDEAMLPNWRTNRPFALKSSNQCAPLPPPRYSTDANSEMYYEAMEVYTSVKNLTQEQRDIALFWADTSVETSATPGHAIAIATQVLQTEEATLSMAALTYSKVGMALADAFIGSWEAKYTHNRARPITYIQQVIDAKWNNPEITDPMLTPPSPAYTSDHAVATGAAMTILTDLFGDHYQFNDLTHVELGLMPRSYSSFMDAAEEASVAQFYGGVHYRSDNEEGLKQGICIGERVNELQVVR